MKPALYSLRQNTTRSWMFPRKLQWLVVTVMVWTSTASYGDKIPGYETDFPPLKYYTIPVPQQARTNNFLGATKIPFGNFPQFAQEERKTTRYQQVYDASEFIGVPEEGAFIEWIFFRGGCQGNNNTEIKDPLIRMSHTSKSADHLSAIFDENLGPEAIQVFPNGRAIAVLGSGVCVTEPVQSYSTTIQLNPPFFYKPSQGNLLLDLTIPIHEPLHIDPRSSYIEPMFNEAVDRPDDGISSISASPSAAATADTVTSAGLVTKFQLAPFPRIYPFLEGTNLLLFFSPLPKGIKLQSRRVQSNEPWSDYVGPANIVGSVAGLAMLYDIPRSSIKEPVLFRLFWNIPQVGVSNPPPRLAPAR